MHNTQKPTPFKGGSLTRLPRALAAEVHAARDAEAECAELRAVVGVLESQLVAVRTVLQSFTAVSTVADGLAREAFSAGEQLDFQRTAKVYGRAATRLSVALYGTGDPWTMPARPLSI